TDARTSWMIEAEAYTSAAATSTHQWTPVTDVIGFSGVALMQILPNNGMSCDPTMFATCGAHLGFAITVDVAGTYYMHVRMWAQASADDSLFCGVDGDGAAAATLMPMHDLMWHWVTSPAIVLAPGAHVLDLWQREAGSRADVIAL